MNPRLLAFYALAALLPAVSAAFTSWMLGEAPAAWSALASWGALLGVAAVGALGVLMAHAARSSRSVAWRAGWIVALAVAAVVAAPLYVMLHVLPAAAPRPRPAA